MFKAQFNRAIRKLRSSAEDLLDKYVPDYQYNRSLNFAMAGRKLTEEQTARSEAILEDHQNRIRLRILLLGKYAECRFQPNHKEEQRVKHIEWILLNHPEHAIAGTPFVTLMSRDDQHYQQIKLIWLEQMARHDRNVAVLTNAAHFFTLSENDLAERCLLRALVLQPWNTRLRHQLAHLYSLWDGHSNQAVGELEKISAEPDSANLFYELTAMPKAAFEAGQFEKAITAAQRLLVLSIKYRRDENYGDAINQAHTVLGRIALKSGNIDKAVFHLKESIIDIATRVTTSFGPSLDLAADLLEAGEKVAVIQYLDELELLCGVNNSRAFEIRFKAERGLQNIAIDRAGLEVYEQALRDHQLGVLKSRAPEKREEHLRRLIDWQRRMIETWSQRIEQSKNLGDTEAMEYSERTKQREHDLLQKLELLSSERGERKVPEA
jgi:tetratricopeptide (TPR) repeat protein